LTHTNKLFTINVLNETQVLQKNMARIVGPLFSLKASGTYCKALSFRMNGDKCSSYLRTAKNVHRSALQNAVCAKVSAMSKAWNSLTPEQITDWNQCGETRGMIGRNLFWSEWFAQNVQSGEWPIIPC
jgi:hypothetical protein